MAGALLAVVRRRIVVAALGIGLGVLMLLVGYRFGPTGGGGWGGTAYGSLIVLGWVSIVLTVFLVLLPALLPHR